MQAIKVDTRSETFLLDVERETLKKAPGFDKHHWPNTSDPEWHATIDSSQLLTNRQQGDGLMKFEIPDLPYNRDALEPHISEETLNYHYGEHHKGYVEKLNKLAAGTQYEEMRLEDVIREAFENEDKGVFNNAAQTWNHTFLWNSMSEDSDGRPDGSLAQKVDETFGDLDGFRRQFKEAATGQFGSGWVWLVAGGNNLEIVATPNAHNPLTTSNLPLLTLDVWEHAYYLDYQNERDRYTDAFLQYLINWEFAQANYDAIRTGRERMSGTG